MLNSGQMELGLINTNIPWLARAATAFPVQILIGILVSIPFTVTIFLGGLSSVPDELYDAAAIEGANRWQQFRFITLPLLRPFVNIAFVLNTIYVFNSFPIIWATTQGGPANSTDILVTYLYKAGFRLGKLGEAAAVSVIMFAILLVFTIIYVRLAMREEKHA
jgi:multiple sugar transport system permease protein